MKIVKEFLNIFQEFGAILCFIVQRGTLLRQFYLFGVFILCLLLMTKVIVFVLSVSL